MCLLRSKLTNDDFRKLLMTPRAAPSSAPPSKSRHHEWVTHTPAHGTQWGDDGDVGTDSIYCFSQNAEGLQWGWGSSSKEEEEEEASPDWFICLSSQIQAEAPPSLTKCFLFGPHQPVEFLIHSCSKWLLSGPSLDTTVFSGNIPQH